MWHVKASGKVSDVLVQVAQQIESVETEANVRQAAHATIVTALQSYGPEAHVQVAAGGGTFNSYIAISSSDVQAPHEPIIIILD